MVWSATEGRTRRPLPPAPAAGSVPGPRSFVGRGIVSSRGCAMIEVRRDPEIYEKAGGWFHARWHFSFDEYHDPANMGVGTLRVFNDDRLIPGAVWPLHPHRDIEGLTYVVEGTFRHQDDVNGPRGMLGTGDAAKIADEPHVTLEADAPTELILVDVAL